MSVLMGNTEKLSNMPTVVIRVTHAEGKGQQASFDMVYVQTWHIRPKTLTCVTECSDKC